MLLGDLSFSHLQIVDSPCATKGLPPPSEPGCRRLRGLHPARCKECPRLCGSVCLITKHVAMLGPRQNAVVTLEASLV